MDMIDYLRSLFRCALKKPIVTDSRNTGQNEQFTVLVRPPLPLQWPLPKGFTALAKIALAVLGGK